MRLVNLLKTFSGLRHTKLDTTLILLALIKVETKENIVYEFVQKVSRN
jgi:hypothetical protein